MLSFGTYICCDILITRNSNTVIQLVINKLNFAYSLKQLGNLDYFLGIECTHIASGALHLSQAKYIRDLLHRAGMDDCKGISTPLPANLKLSRSGADYFDNPLLHRSIVGALQYATITRPELGYSINKIFQFMSQTLISHWTTVKRILIKISKGHY